jgi:hypothetical protein
MFEGKAGNALSSVHLSEIRVDITAELKHISDYKICG